MFRYLYKLSLGILISTLLTTAPHLAIADDSTLELPGRAWTKTKVEQVFGAPRDKRSPIGEPPITVWQYSGFNVYFEYNRVIHSVKHYAIQN